MDEFEVSLNDRLSTWAESVQPEVPPFTPPDPRPAKGQVWLGSVVAVAVVVGAVLVAFNLPGDEGEEVEFGSGETGTTLGIVTPIASQSRTTRSGLGLNLEVFDDSALLHAVNERQIDDTHPECRAIESLTASGTVDGTHSTDLYTYLSEIETNDVYATTGWGWANPNRTEITVVVAARLPTGSHPGQEVALVAQGAEQDRASTEGGWAVLGYQMPWPEATPVTTGFDGELVIHDGTQVERVALSVTGTPGPCR